VHAGPIGWASRPAYHERHVPPAGLSNAATFGFTENERSEVRLTSLGRRIADPAQETDARIEAFLCAPLDQWSLENYDGFSLPGPGALEKIMGVVKTDWKSTPSIHASGGPPDDLHPFIQGLLKELPAAGDVWPEAKLKLWLDTAARIFKNHP
jgi:hypothetical protein